MRRVALAFVMLVAACGGGDGNSTGDAGNGSDGGDGGGSGAEPVTVSVHDNDGVAAAGVRVYFQNLDSSLIASAMTDASGVATAQMPNSGFGRVVDRLVLGAGNTWRLHTVVGVKPGDNVVVDEPGRVSVTLIGNTSAGSGDINFSTPCGVAQAAGTTNGKPSATLMVDRSCLKTTDVFEYKFDSGGLVVINWGYLQDVAPSGTTFDASAIAVTHADAESQSKHVVFTNDTSYTSRASEEQQTTSAGVINSSLAGALSTFDVKVYVVPGARDVMFWTGKKSMTKHMFYDWDSTFQASYSADVSTKLLRQGTSEPMYDVANHRLVWTEASTGLAPEWGYTKISATRNALTFEWFVVGAAGASAIQLPTLPVEGSIDYNLAQGDVLDVTALVVGRSPGGYDAVRENLNTYGASTPYCRGGTSSMCWPSQIVSQTQSGTMALQDFFAP